MRSTRPYLLRAFYEWIADNNCTPYIVLDVEDKSIDVPSRFVEGNQIVLNISMSAVKDLHIDNEYINFHARFSGVSHHIIAPISAVVAIYAEENGRGMVFAEEDLPPEGDGGSRAPLPSSTNKDADKKSPNKKSHLTVVK
jgi:stringent starvation protein B